MLFPLNTLYFYTPRHVNEYLKPKGVAVQPWMTCKRKTTRQAEVQTLRSAAPLFVLFCRWGVRGWMGGLAT